MGKKFYHNPSKGIVNILEVCDFLETFTSGDSCFYTEEGDAILYDLEHDDIVDLINICDEQNEEDDS